jgi:hypothetical protein
MSAGKYVGLQGTCARTCPDCGVTITVTRPLRPITADTTRRQRRQLAAELKRQVWWDLVASCNACLSWWNDAVLRVEQGMEPPSKRGSRRAASPSEGRPENGSLAPGETPEAPVAHPSMQPPPRGYHRRDGANGAGAAARAGGGRGPRQGFCATAYADARTLACVCA